jgi:hypothetical protein
MHYFLFYIEILHFLNKFTQKERKKERKRKKGKERKLKNYVHSKYSTVIKARY